MAICKVAASLNGIGWQPAIDLADTEDIYAPCLQIFGDDIFLFTFAGWRSHLKVKRLIIDGANIKASVVNGPRDELAHGAAAAEFGNNLYAVYTTVDSDDRRNNNLYLSRYLPEKGIFEENGTMFWRTTVSSDRQDIGPPCAVVYNGELWVFYHNERAGIWSVRWDGGGDPAQSSSWRTSMVTNVASWQQVSAVVYLDRLYLASFDTGERANTVWLNCYKAGGWSRPVEVFNNAWDNASLAVVRGLMHITARGVDGYLMSRVFDGNSFGPTVGVRTPDGPAGGPPRSSSYTSGDLLVAAWRSA